MPVGEGGFVVPRNTAAIRRTFIEALRAHFGSDVNTTKSGPAMEFFDSALQLPLREIDRDMEELQNNVMPDTANFHPFRKIVSVLGFEPDPATRSTGKVNVNLGTIPDSPDPFFEVGDLVFVDARGERYDMSADVDLPTTAEFTISLQAQTLGVDGNTDAGNINRVEFINSTINTRWSNHVDSFTNDANIDGGQDEEDLRTFRNRVRFSRAARPSGSISGIEESVRRVDGVTGARGIENTKITGSSRENTSEHTGDAASSETVDATTTRIAQKVTITDRRFTQRVALKLNTNNSLEADIRLETDSAGSPSGSLVDSVFEKSYAFDGTSEEVILFNNGEYIDAGTYHVVAKRTSGSGTFAGTAGTGANVQLHDGSWTASANVDDIYHKVIGGIPPRSFRVFVSGSFEDNDVAESIGTSKSAGIPSDGLESGTWGNSVTERWDLPIEVPVVVKATVEVDGDFAQDAEFLEDLVIQYTGGTDNNGNDFQGLALDEDVIRHQIVSRLLDKDLVTGTHDVTTLLLEQKSVRATPGDLQPGDTSNLPMGIDEEATIETVADIEITTVEV